MNLFVENIFTIQVNMIQHFTEKYHADISLSFASAELCTLRHTTGRIIKDWSKYLPPIHGPIYAFGNMITLLLSSGQNLEMRPRACLPNTGGSKHASR